MRRFVSNHAIGIALLIAIVIVSASAYLFMDLLHAQMLDALDSAVSILMACIALAVALAGYRKFILDKRLPALLRVMSHFGKLSNELRTIEWHIEEFMRDDDGIEITGREAEVDSVHSYMRNHSNELYSLINELSSTFLTALLDESPYLDRHTKRLIGRAYSSLRTLQSIRTDFILKREDMMGNCDNFTKSLRELNLIASSASEHIIDRLNINKELGD